MNNHPDTSLEYLLLQLVNYCLRRQIPDIHMECQNGILEISLRLHQKVIALQQDIFTPSFFEFLKYKASLNLCAPTLPQSGSFSLNTAAGKTDCRFSALQTARGSTGVLRLLHAGARLTLEQLTRQPGASVLLAGFAHLRDGLVISCGPTGSGKTTTIHALLRLLQSQGKKIITLEDPVEIREEGMIQIQTCESGPQGLDAMIAAALRHDPNVIFIGECRSEVTAHMAIRAALTGHLVLTTLHAASGSECLHRLMDLKVSAGDLQEVLQGVFAQRLVEDEKGKQCLYEIWTKKELEGLFKHADSSFPALPFPKTAASNFNADV